ncbi:type II toxin-antitoxin system VapC family toxin [Natronospirillum operosum]|uniref:Type II toxin-antitoxin system VapC family toxin n=1 Tax=Natronospirillum operosum TaxID=2759953 RepID=A0A4Z0W856_9GAMM|nr:type II toxin-antitoxin system VapC family toxin [Natronospirillum operosum]TGG93587.1 type II toxin-antitoxin system VapC family toxin [Natronospirillum operosum]
MIVLDTHVLVWWVNGSGQLSLNAKNAIEDERVSEEGLVLVSAISAWEIAMLVRADRLTLTMSVDDWLDTVAAIEGVRFVPIDNEVGVESTRLPGAFHKDPADRMIVALARHMNAPLATADNKIRAYKHVKSIW